MIVDEQTLTDALHSLAGDVPPRLMSEVRRGGRQRLLRRRRYAAVGVVAVGAAAAPAVAAVRSSGHGRGSTTVAVGTPSATPTTLYALPPAAGSQCNADSGSGPKGDGHARASAYPQLLLLPKDQSVSYAFMRAYEGSCAPPHVALTLLDEQGHAVPRGVLVEGPNAPTAQEAGYAGPSIQLNGENGHRPIRANDGLEYTVEGTTNAFWTEADGGQWHAEVKGMSQAAAVQLLDRLSLDSHAGTATLPDASAHGWTVAPPATDQPAGVIGTLIAQWTPSGGRPVDLTVTAGPNRTDQRAVTARPEAMTTAVDGHPAVTSYGSQFATLTWQEAAGVQVEIDVEGGTVAEAKQAADSLAMTTPSDPRIHG